MKKVYKERQLLELINIPADVIKAIRKVITIIDDFYKEDRNVEFDLGGYVVIAENIVDIEMLKQGKLKEIVAEYTDVIECSEGVNWTSSLFLLSSDFSIVVITTEELSKFLLG
ncbi:MAG: hypothetical protein ACI398_04310 [Clostridium sp.]